MKTYASTLTNKAFQGLIVTMLYTSFLYIDLNAILYRLLREEVIIQFVNVIRI